MARKIEDVNLNIAKNIVSKLPSGWKEACVEVQLFGDAAEFKGRYNLNNSVNQFKVHHSALDDFEELQELMVQEGKEKWNRAKFILQSSGKFNIDFEWDKILFDEIKKLS